MTNLCPTQSMQSHQHHPPPSLLLAKFRLCSARNVCVCACVRVFGCMRACLRMCAWVCVCVRACVHACGCVHQRLIIC